MIGRKDSKNRVSLKLWKATNQVMWLNDPPYLGFAVNDAWTKVEKKVYTYKTHVATCWFTILNKNITHLPQIQVKNDEGRCRIYISLWLWCAVFSVSCSPQGLEIHCQEIYLHSWFYFFSIAIHVEFIPFYLSTLLKFHYWTWKNES